MTIPGQDREENRMASERKPTNLIVVCCHGIWAGGPSAGADESEWLIADFQRGETGIFTEHIRAGIRCLSQDRGNSVLAFSGYCCSQTPKTPHLHDPHSVEKKKKNQFGQKKTNQNSAATRKETHLSEAQSYHNLAVANAYFQLLPPSSPPSHPQEILIEDRALDSYHNVLFSLTLFWATFRAWPATLTIISHAFKEPRIARGHCAALGFPLDRVRYPALMDGVVDDPVSAAGVARAEAEWTRDPHGRGESLAGKRAARNPWGVWQGVFPKGTNYEDGGLKTIGEGAGEMIDPDAARPF